MKSKKIMLPILLGLSLINLKGSCSRDLKKLQNGEKNLSNCDFQNADFRFKKFQELNLDNAKLNSACLYKTQFIKTSMNNADLSAKKDIWSRWDNLTSDFKIFWKNIYTSFIQTIKNIKSSCKNHTDNPWKNTAKHTLSSTKENVLLSLNIPKSAWYLSKDFAFPVSKNPFENNRVGCIFKELDATNANFSNTQLQGSIFNNVNLTQSNFQYCCLHGAIFKEAKLQHADFEKSNLWNTSFTHSDLTDTNFDNTQLWNVIFDENTILKNASFKDAIGLSYDQKKWLHQKGAINIYSRKEIKTIQKLQKLFRKKLKKQSAK